MRSVAERGHGRRLEPTRDPRDLAGRPARGARARPRRRSSSGARARPSRCRSRRCRSTRNPARVFVVMTRRPSAEKPCVSHQVVSCTMRRGDSSRIPEASETKSATMTSHVRFSVRPPDDALAVGRPVGVVVRRPGVALREPRDLRPVGPHRVELLAEAAAVVADRVRVVAIGDEEERVAGARAASGRRRCCPAARSVRQVSPRAVGVRASGSATCRSRAAGTAIFDAVRRERHPVGRGSRPSRSRRRRCETSGTRIAAGGRSAAA